MSIVDLLPEDIDPSGFKTWVETISQAVDDLEPLTDGREVELQTTATHIQWRYVGDAEWTNLIALSELEGDPGQQGDQGPAGDSPEIRVTATHIQWKLTEDETWNDLIAISELEGADGTNGADGSEVELQASATHIQWRYVGDAEWVNLIALSELEGDPGNDGAPGNDGDSAEFRVTATHIQWKLTEDETWNDLIALSELEGEQGAPGDPGDPGDDGREVELQVTATHIQWRLAGDSWTNLIALSELEGAPGADGDEVELRVTATHIQWKLTESETWNDLIALSELEGPQGDSHVPSASGQADGHTVVVNNDEFVVSSEPVVLDDDSRLSDARTPTTHGNEAHSESFITSTGAPVQSVNTETGAVVLDAADVGARPDDWVPAWTDVTDKPSTFPPSEHDHDADYDAIGSASSAQSAAESYTDSAISGLADVASSGDHDDLINKTFGFVDYDGDNNATRPNADTVYWKNWPAETTPANSQPGDLVFVADE